MSERNDLDLDAILAEFYQEEQKPVPPAEPAAMTRRERAAAQEAQEAQRPRAEALLSSEQRAEEGTMVYPAKAARAETSPAPARPKPQVRPKPHPRPAVQERLEPVSLPEAGRQEKPAPRTKKKPRQGRGFALMLLVLALLAAALFALVRWTLRAEKAAQPAAPEPLRLELGADLERALDESASTSR